jgi:hypothetical protein
MVSIYFIPLHNVLKVSPLRGVMLEGYYKRVLKALSFEVGSTWFAGS